MNYKIITIERQFGSGGHEIGESLAKKLGISFYDHNLIELAADYGNIHKDLLTNADEKRPGSLLYQLFDGANVKTGYHLPVQDAVYNLESGVIRHLAEKEPCILVGRCADYVLKSRADTLSVFVGADLEHRISRVMKLEQLSEKEALLLIKKMDKNRAYYYNYYTDQTWGDITSFDLSLNSGDLSVTTCVDLLACIYENLSK